MPNALPTAVSLPLSALLSFPFPRFSLYICKFYRRQLVRGNFQLSRAMFYRPTLELARRDKLSRYYTSCRIPPRLDDRIAKERLSL